MRKKIKSLFIISIILTLILSGCEKKEKLISREEFMMNTLIQIDIYGESKDGILDDIFNRIQEIENLTSKTKPSSDIYRINENAGVEPVKVNSETYYILEKAVDISKKTKGNFNPTIGPLVSLWDINASEENRTWLPNSLDIESKKDLVSIEKLELLGDDYVYLKEPGMELDLGGIVKGYTEDEIIRILKDEGIQSAMLDLGGDLYAYGEKPKGDLWNIGIQNPMLESRDYMGILSIKNKSVVTSGNYERYFKVDEKIYHHIINPWTGYPSESDLSSVSVITDKGIDGDAYATAFYILGLNKSKLLIEELGDNIDAIFVMENGDIYLTEGIKGSFKLRDGEKNFKLVH